MDKLVSIIVPIYGVAEVLDECVESLVKQTYNNIEIILVDDGSKDGSGDICDKWAEIDARVVVIHQPNRGVSEARNAGLDYAHGKYISFVDGDDIVEPNYIDALVNAILQENDFALCSYYCFSEKQWRNISYPVITGNYEVKNLLQAIFFGYYEGRSCTMVTGLWLGLFKREMIEQKHIRFDTLLKKSEDWLFYAEYLPMCRKMAVVNEPLYGYRQFEKSAMHEYKVPTDLGIERSLYILQKFESLMKAASIEENLWKSLLSKRYMQMAKRYAIGVWDERNTMSMREKYDMTKRFTKIDNVYDRFKEEVIQQIWLRNACCLGIYARCYLTARKIKHMLRGR